MHHLQLQPTGQGGAPLAPQGGGAHCGRGAVAAAGAEPLAVVTVVAWGRVGVTMETAATVQTILQHRIASSTTPLPAGGEPGASPPPRTRVAPEADPTLARAAGIRQGAKAQAGAAGQSWKEGAYLFSPSFSLIFIFFFDERGKGWGW